jgi:hypothetical protein
LGGLRQALGILVSCLDHRGPGWWLRFLTANCNLGFWITCKWPFSPYSSRGRHIQHLFLKGWVSWERAEAVMGVSAKPVDLCASN